MVKYCFTFLLFLDVLKHNINTLEAEGKMKFQEIRLITSDLERIIAFYEKVLNLKITHHSEDAVSFQIGKTILSFRLSMIPNAVYHYAINIPENQFEAACNWLRDRVSTILYEGSDVINFQNWNAQSIYFYDSVGNIGELIARHHLKNETDVPFCENSLLEISEIGLPTANILELKALLNQYLGIDTYVSGDATFQPLGDENGLFIVVVLNRVWFMTDIQATYFPIEIVLKTEQKINFEAGGYRFLST